MYFEFLESECIALITKICCLLVFYNFKLSPLLQTRLENNKKLYYFKDQEDLPRIYFALCHIEQSLLNDIWEIYEPYLEKPEKRQNGTWIFDW